MQTLDVLTKKELMARYKITAHFIKTHPELGGFGKPKSYAVEVVEEVLRGMAWAPHDKKQQPEKKKARLPAFHARPAAGGTVVQIGDLPILTQYQNIRQGARSAS